MSLSTSMGFDVGSNVEITVMNKKRKIIQKVVKKHNKATRQMITGILRFLTGQFNPTNLNSTPYYTDVEQYIPCFIGVGDGGVLFDTNGYPAYDEDTRIPVISTSWNEIVPYSSTGLQRELFVKTVSGNTVVTGTRSRIRKVGTTLTNDPAGDMDTLYLYCEISPNSLNTVYNNNPVIITEIGLFASDIPGTKDLLAYVKLGNYKDEESSEWKTKALFVRPEDTVIIKWYITIAAIGEDSIFTGNEESVVVTPTLGTMIVNNN